MADVKISALPVATSTASPDVLPIVQSGVTKQVDVSLLGGSAVRFNNPGGRLTTESGVPVSTADRTNQGTIYYTPFIHNNIVTWSGSIWQAKIFSEISLALAVTNGKNYDVFVNSSANALSLSNAWTNDTTRADALGTQDGVSVLGSDPTKLWLGTIRASGTNVTADSGGGSLSQVGGKRFVWNAYNQVTRTVGVIDATPTWNYATATVRQANAASGNKVEYVTGFSTDVIDVTVHACAIIASNTVAGGSGVGIDSTTTFSGVSNSIFNGGSAGFLPSSARYVGSPGLGYHYASWNEIGLDGTCTFVGSGTGGASGLNSGIAAVVSN
jgi:hypothetical protein